MTARERGPAAHEAPPQSSRHQAADQSHRSPPHRSAAAAEYEPGGAPTVPPLPFMLEEPDPDAPAQYIAAGEPADDLDGAAVLDEVAGFVSQYVAFPSEHDLTA